MAQKTKLKAAQKRALLVLAQGGSVQDALAAAQVSRRTIERWRRLPEFVAALRDAESAALMRLSRRLSNASDKAVSVLLSVLDDKSASDQARIRAAQIILTARREFGELVTLSERVETLEQRMNE